MELIAKEDKTYGSMQEIWKDFFPSLCPQCGHNQSCSSAQADSERGDLTSDLDPGSRHCLRCHFQWVPQTTEREKLLVEAKTGR